MAVGVYVCPQSQSLWGGGEAEDEEPFLGVTSDSGGSGRKEQQGWLARQCEQHLPSLSKKQRIMGFMTSLVLGRLDLHYHL